MKQEALVNNGGLMMVTSLYCLGLFLVAGLALVIPRGYSLGFYILCLVSLMVWLFVRTPLISKNDRFFFFPLLAYAFGHMLMAMNEQLTGRVVEPFVPFILVLFGIWGIRRYKPDAAWLWLGIAFGAIGAAMISGYQSLALGMRANGHTNAIQFGNIALLFGVLCMVQAMVVPGRGIFKILMWLGFASGVAASVWSQTRGGWLAVVLILMWILKNATRGWPRNKQISVFVLVFACIAIPVLPSNGLVQYRINDAVVHLKAFIETGEQNNSVGIRVAMWSLGLDGFMQAPFFGNGDKGWLEIRDAAIANGRLAEFTKDFTHLHNEYINVAFKRGLIGLILYLTMFLIPMIFFFKPFVLDDRPNVRALAMAGMVLPMMFMDFAITQSFLVHNSGRMILCGLWMSFAGLMLNAVQVNPDNYKEYK